MSLTEDIKAQLGNPSQRKTINASDFTDSGFGSFLSDGLGVDSLVVTRFGSTRLISEATDPLVIAGRTTIFGVNNVTVVIELSDVEGHLEAQLTATYPNNETITPGPIDWISLEAPGVTLSMTTTFQLYALGMFGTLNLGDTAIPILLEKISAETWRLTLGDGEPIQLPGTSAIADLTGGDAVGDFLPQEVIQDAVISNFRVLALNGMSATFNPSERTVSEFTLGLKLVGLQNNDPNWEVIPDVLNINDLGFNLNILNPVAPAGVEKELIGIIYGTFVLGGVSFPIFVSGSVGGANIWSLGIIPEESVTLPGVGDILSLVGDEDFVNSLPDAIRNLPGITVEDLIFDFQPAQRRIIRLYYNIALDSYEIVEDFLTLETFQVESELINLNDPAQRQIETHISTQLEISDIGILFSLDKAFDDTEWTLTGGLAPDEVISLSEIFEKFLGDDYELPPTVPEVTLTELSLSVMLTSKIVHFTSVSAISMEILEDKFAIQSLFLEFDYDPTVDIAAGEKKLTGRIAGSLLVAGVEFLIFAQLPESADDGLLFGGGTGPGQSIQLLDALIPDLERLGSFSDSNALDALKDALEEFTIEDLSFTYETRSRNLTFLCKGMLPLDDLTLNFQVKFMLAKPAGAAPQTPYNIDFESQLKVKDLEFAIDFSKTGAGSNFFATFHREGGLSYGLSELLGEINPDLQDSVPELSVTLLGAMFAYQKKTGQPKGNLLFGVSIATKMNFANLPLVGSLLPKPIGVDNVQILYSTGAWTLPDVNNFNSGIPDNLSKLPAGEIGQGVNLSAGIQFGDTTKTIGLPNLQQRRQTSAPPAGGGGGPAGGGGQASQPLQLPAASSPGKWFNVNKQLGPLQIAKVGVNFADSYLWLMLDAAVTLGPITLILEDLSFGSPLDRFAPQFNLRGFGLRYASGPVEVSGLFLRVQNKPDSGGATLPGVGDRFAGAAVIKTSKLTIAAIGEYATINGEPSFYLYAYLGMPLGGPAFFFVEGLAAGFGFNRSVWIPPIELVERHPLVSIATEGTDDVLKLAEALISGNFIPIDPGKIFLAIGVRFSTFKLLDSFALLIVTFGESFRLDILGRSKLVLPTPEAGKSIPPLAEVTMLVKGSFIPDEGFLGVEARLTPDSYVLSRDCTLQGGFAFYTWFPPSPKAGDFVVTLGGYHPNFPVPDHYPRVPRLGFNWQITPQLSLKGRLYFALTATAVMAGGSLEATWKDGSLKAWFIIGADFLIAWKPYRYEAGIYMRMGISYTFWFFGEQTISFDIGVDLQVWGPEFSGIATIDLDIVSFSVKFGPDELTPKQPIPWSTFRESFLPAAGASLAITEGLIRNAEDDKTGAEIWVVNPKAFTLTSDSVIPLKRIDSIASPETNFGVSPVGVSPASLDTSLNVSIVKVIGNAEEDQKILFTFTAITKSVPKGLWGTKLEYKEDEEDLLIENVLAGVTIQPVSPPDPDQMAWLEKKELAFNEELGDNGRYRWEAVPAFDKDSTAPAGDKLDAATMLTELGFGGTVLPSFDTSTLKEELDLAGEPMKGTY